MTGPMQFKLPELGEGVLEAELVKWLVQPGESVAVGQPLAEVMTDKAVVDLPSPFAGQITELLVKDGDIVRVGAEILNYEDGEAPKATADVAQQQPTDSPAPAASGNGEPVATTATRVPAGPAVRRKAKELGIDLSAVKGTGPGGRVLKADLETHAASPEETSVHPAPTRVGAAPQPGPGTRIPLRGLRRTIAQHMVRSKQTIPHYSYIDECDVTELVRLRDSLRPVFEKDGVKLTYLAFIVKAVAEALREVPQVNASLDEEAGEIVVHEQCNVGFAVATEDGLIVPVIHDVDCLGVRKIAAAIERLSGEARSGRARREDLTGGTFTVSSIGGIGGLVSTPIINAPQVGILALGKIIRRPVYDDRGELRPADLMYLSFSFDHRVLDGAVGATFANAIIERLENPALLLVS